MTVIGLLCMSATLSVVTVMLVLVFTVTLRLVRVKVVELPILLLITVIWVLLVRRLTIVVRPLSGPILETILLTLIRLVIRLVVRWALLASSIACRLTLRSRLIVWVSAGWTALSIRTRVCILVLYVVRIVVLAPVILKLSLCNYWGALVIMGMLLIALAIFSLGMVWKLLRRFCLGRVPVTV